MAKFKEEIGNVINLLGGHYIFIIIILLLAMALSWIMKPLIIKVCDHKLDMESKRLEAEQKRLESERDKKFARDDKQLEMFSQTLDELKESRICLKKMLKELEILAENNRILATLLKEKQDFIEIQRGEIEELRQQLRNVS